MTEKERDSAPRLRLPNFLESTALILGLYGAVLATYVAIGDFRRADADRPDVGIVVDARSLEFIAGEDTPTGILRLVNRGFLPVSILEIGGVFEATEAVDVGAAGQRVTTLRPHVEVHTGVLPLRLDGQEGVDLDLRLYPMRRRTATPKLDGDEWDEPRRGAHGFLRVWALTSLGDTIHHVAEVTVVGAALLPPAIGPVQPPPS